MLLANRRDSDTFKEKVDRQTYFITLGYSAEGIVGEVFIDCSKAGAPLRATMSSFGRLISLALQHDVPVDDVCRALIDSHNHNVFTVVASILRKHEKLERPKKNEIPNDNIDNTGS